MIRRRDHDFEDRLSGQYFQPQIIPVPDDFSPEVPRMIFGSEHGFSQIIVSQINISLNVSYSPDWQIDISKGKEYLNEKIPILFDLVESLEGAEANFCGFNTKVRLTSSADDKSILSHIAKLFLSGDAEANLHDLQIKKTSTCSEQFYSNQTVSNYRVWKSPESQAVVPHLSQNQIIERGIEITGDYNDRYGYNQNLGYESNRDVANIIVAQGIDKMGHIIALMKE